MNSIPEFRTKKEAIGRWLLRANVTALVLFLLSWPFHQEPASSVTISFVALLAILGQWYQRNSIDEGRSWAIVGPLKPIGKRGGVILALCTVPVLIGIAWILSSTNHPPLLSWAAISILYGLILWAPSEVPQLKEYSEEEIRDISRRGHRQYYLGALFMPPIVFGLLLLALVTC